MATWAPPIPAGKLYSPDALALGSGLALLAWLYDGVQRDATVIVRLEEAAKDLGVPYRTIKTWWAALRQGPYFSKQQDRGKAGWVVKFADEWIDWRVFRANYPDTNPQPSSPSQGQNMELETIESPVKAPSKPRQGQEMALNPIYKEDQLDQDSLGDEAVRLNTATQSGKSVKSRTKTEPTDPQYQELFEAIATVCQLDLKLCTTAQRQQVAQAAKKLLGAQKQAEQVILFGQWWAKNDWRGRKGEPPRPAQVLDSWSQWEKKHATQRALDLTSGHEWQGCSPAPLDQPF